MTDDLHNTDAPRAIATIQNQSNPDQSVDLVYLPEESGFATSGIRTHFDLPEILIPAHLVTRDIQLIGAIVSAILERISQAGEKDGTFEYASRFTVLDGEYTFTPHGPYMKLAAEASTPDWAKDKVV
jgi:hypothetical protein